MLAHAVGRGHPVGQPAGVPVGVQRVGEQADHRDGAVGGGVQRQGAVVLQQHHRLTRGLAGQRPVLRSADGVGADAAVGAAVGVELAETDPDGQRVPDGPVDIGLGEQTLLERAAHGLPGGSAVGVVGGEAVHPGLQARGVGLRERVVVVLRTHEVVGAERVGDVVQGLVGPGADALADVGLTVTGRPLTRLYDVITPVAASAWIGIRNDTS